MTATDTSRAIEAAFRIEQAKLIAGLTRMVRDIGLAEELAQDALVAALEQWPNAGMPDHPGAWLMTAAKHRAIDAFRRNRLRDRKHEELGYELELEQETAQADLDAALDDQFGDDLLRLIFISCHPILSPEARDALTLRLIGGLTSEEIARAFLVPEPTVQQRIENELRRQQFTALRMKAQQKLIRDAIIRYHPDEEGMLRTAVEMAAQKYKYWRTADAKTAG